MANKTRAPRARRTRLVNLYYRTARNIYWVLKDEHETTEVKNFVISKLDELTQLAGIDFPDANPSAAEKAFIESVRAIVTRTGESLVHEGVEAGIIIALTDEAGEVARRRGRRFEAESEAKPKQYSFCIGGDHPLCGLRDGDRITVETGDLRIGDVCVTSYQLDGEEVYSAGHLVSFTAEGFTITDERGRRDFRFSDVEYAGRVVSFQREVKRGAESATEHSAGSHDLTALMARLETLRRDGDITDESTIFRIEKQIYDLENAPQESDEWPEVVNVDWD
jgi:hypothetical protein